MCCIGLVIIGILSFLSIPVELFPSLDYPELVVQTRCPNTTPEQVEQNITRPLEESLAAVQGQTAMFSQSFEGLSIIHLQFDWGTDMKYARLSAQERLDRILQRLPKNTHKPFIAQTSASSRPMAVIAICGANLYDTGEFAEYMLKRRFEQIDGIAAAEVQGAPVREIRILVRPNRLNDQGLFLRNIHSALKQSNIIYSGGSIRHRDFKYAIKLEGEYKSVAEIANTPIVFGNRSFVKLKDIARVEAGLKERQSAVRYNGRPCITLELYTESGGNTLQITRRLKAVLEEAKTEYSDIEIIPLYFQADFIDKSVRGTVLAAIMGGALAFIVLFLFLKEKRAAVIIIFSVPLSVFATISIMYFRGISFNLISLAGLALGIGMLVDNSIIVLENIHRLRQQGIAVYKSAWTGASQVFLPITASTITTIAVFLPLIFLKDVSAFIFRQQAETVAWSLLASLVVSMSVIPLLYYRIYKNSKSGIPQNFMWFVRFEHYYDLLLKRILRFPSKSIGSFILSLLLALLLLFLLDRQLFPRVDQNQVLLKFRFLPGVVLDYIENRVTQIESQLLSSSLYDHVFVHLGRSHSLYQQSRQWKTNRAVIKADCRLPVNKIMNHYRQKSLYHEKIDLQIEQPQPLMDQLFLKRKYPITIDILGPDFQVLDSLSLAVIQGLETILPNRLAGVNYFERYPAIVLKPNREALARHGLYGDRVLQRIQYLLKGKVPTRLRKGEKKIDIVVRGSDEYKSDLNRALQSRVATIPIGELVTLQHRYDYFVIERSQQSRLFRLYIQPIDERSKAVALKIKQLIQNLNIPAEYDILLGGEWRQSKRSLEQLLFAFILAIVLVYLVMAAQFESMRLPFIILFTIPFALVGITPVMVLSGTSLNVMSGIGFVVVVGIVVNDAIIKIEFVNRLHRDGMSVDLALQQAGKLRLRPILMTTITTIAGLSPFALNLVDGSQLQRPMAVVIIAGIVTATILTLFLLPLLYKIIFGIKCR
jgi:HAE1 family hydrophobic/amphiphilic exporter-1